MVDFNNETFRRLIEYSKNRGEFSYTDIFEAEGWQDDRNKMYREDEVMLTDAYIYSVGDVVDTMFSFGFEDAVFVGIPRKKETWLSCNPLCAMRLIRTRQLPMARGNVRSRAQLIHQK